MWNFGERTNFHVQLHMSLKRNISHKAIPEPNALMLPTFVYIVVSYLFTFLEFARMRIHIKCPSCCHNAAIEETHSSPVHQLDNLYTMEGVKSSIILFKQITRRLLNKR